MSHKPILITFLIMIFLILATAILGLIKPPTSLRPTVINFNDCLQAGYPVGESYPRQCWTPDGTHFVESITTSENPPTTSIQATEKGTGSVNSIDQEIIKQKQQALESAYPPFQDFENQDSFAGQSIKAIASAGDHYFAYMTHGSGVPIAQATCFRVDSKLNVTQIGQYPDPTDSYTRYPDIDPSTCQGINTQENPQN